MIRVSTLRLASRPGLSRLNEVVDTLQDAVANAGLEPVENAVPVVFDGVGRLDHGHQLRVRDPVVPALQEFLARRKK